MKVGIIVFFLVILIIAIGILAFIASRSKGRAILDQEKYRSDWLRIEQGVAKDNETSFHLAIINADKLLDRALRERGFSGATMGERMKAAQSVWNNANHVWGAHKIRNQIAHETDVKISYDTTRRSLAAFKQALKDTGAI